MSWLFSLVYDRLMRVSEEACLAQWRAELLADLRGEVLEIGAGTGANLPHYPAAVTRVVLAEPERHMRRRLERRLAERPDLRFEIVDAAAERLPGADASFDAVVSTLVLCSVSDPAQTLAEVRRVLRPDGRFVFLEHVAAERPDRLWWQQRLEPVWKRLTGNCHLTRRTAEAIVAAGFRIESERRESVRKAMPVVRPSVRGVARKLGS